MMTPGEWAEDEGPISMSDALVGLDHITEDLDMVDEAITHHRHEATDSAVVVELHAIGDDVTQAWAHVKRAHAALQALIATGGVV